MFRRTIELTESANVEAEVVNLETTARQRGLKGAVAHELSEKFRDALEPLVESGRQLRPLGSQMDLTRSISGAGYEVKLKFTVGSRPSFLKRLFQSLRII